MQTHVMRQTSELRTLLRTLQVIALIELVYSAAILVRGTAPNADGLHLLYISWFAVAIVAVQAILHWIKAGVVLLVVATLAVALAELIGGVATIGGASLGLLVVYILTMYIRPIWYKFD